MTRISFLLPARSRSRDGLRTTAAFWGRVRLATLCLLLALVLPADGYLGPARTDLVIRQAIRGQGFQLAAWEVQAIGQKLRDAAARPGAELSPQEQHDLVTAYFDAIGRIGQLEAEIGRLYADPANAEPAAAAAHLQAELDALRARQAGRRPAVERILEQQVATVLAEVGLATAGHIWPPVRFQFTASPNYLIVSPRQRIAVARGVYLDPLLPVDEMERIEAHIQDGLDVSALVEGTGGFSSYPTMVLENASLSWVVDTIAHEWAHTYLAFRPLGWNYYKEDRMRTINETVASIIGEEISRRVIARFYPERMGPAPWPRPLSMRRDWLKQEGAPAEFEFGAFMRQTRLEVDRLLADGRIAEAEAYMEARRRSLVERGYAIRKLNQAYFAFHGSYAVGTAATDPIGGKLRLLRRRAGDLAAFVRTVAAFNDAADLDAALAAPAVRDLRSHPEPL
ncbi:MAG: hypothetical protein ACUVR4_03275 [Anaerolineae bacterium]